MKHLPVFPDRFASLGLARQFLEEFVNAYNHHHRHTGTPAHRHTGIGMYTPADELQLAA